MYFIQLAIYFSPVFPLLDIVTFQRSKTELKFMPWKFCCIKSDKKLSKSIPKVCNIVLTVIQILEKLLSFAVKGRHRNTQSNIIKKPSSCNIASWQFIFHRTVSNPNLYNSEQRPHQFVFFFYSIAWPPCQQAVRK